MRKILQQLALSFERTLNPIRHRVVRVSKDAYLVLAFRPYPHPKIADPKTLDNRRGLSKWKYDIDRAKRAQTKNDAYDQQEKRNEGYGRRLNRFGRQKPIGSVIGPLLDGEDPMFFAP